MKNYGDSVEGHIGVQMNHLVPVEGFFFRFKWIDKHGDMAGYQEIRDSWMISYGILWNPQIWMSGVASYSP